MFRQIIKRPAFWSLLLLAGSVGWYCRPIDRSTLFPVWLAHGQCGYVNADGRVAIDFVWNEAYAFGRDGYAFVVDDDKIGFIDREGQLAEPLEEARVVDHPKGGVILRGVWCTVTNSGQVVARFGGELTPIRQAKPQKWGLAKYSKIVIAPAWDAIKPMDDHGFALVTKDEKSGFIDRTGKVVIPLQWPSVEPFAKNGLARVSTGLAELGNRVRRRGRDYIVGIPDENNSAGFIDRTGKVVIPMEWNDVHSFDDAGLALVTKQGKYGFIDSMGKVAIPLEWDHAGSFDAGGLAHVIRGDFAGCINRKGALVIPLQWDAIDAFDDFTLEQASDFEIVDQAGETVTHLPTRPVRRAGIKGLAKVSRNDKHGYLDRAGVEVVAVEWDELSAFNPKGLALAKRGDVCGLVDREGHTVVLPQWDKEVVNFGSEAWATVARDGKFGCIDSGGKVVLPLVWNSWVLFDEQGIARVAKERKIGFIDRTGKPVVPLVWDHADTFIGDIAQVTKDGACGYINRLGNIVLTPEWEQVTRLNTREARIDSAEPVDPLTPDLIKVTKGKKHGIVDWAGKVIIPPEWDSIQIRSDAESKRFAFVVSRGIEAQPDGWLKTTREWFQKLIGRDRPAGTTCHLYDIDGTRIWSSESLSEAFWLIALSSLATFVMFMDGVVQYRRSRLATRRLASVSTSPVTTPPVA